MEDLKKSSNDKTTHKVTKPRYVETRSRHTD
jgi:hypothetical protein